MKNIRMKNKVSKLLIMQTLLFLFGISAFGQDSFSNFSGIYLSMEYDFPIECVFSGLNKDDEGGFTYEVYNPDNKKIKMRIVNSTFNCHFVYEGKEILTGEVVDINKRHFFLTLHYKEFGTKKYPYSLRGSISVEFIIGKKKKRVVDIKCHSVFKVFTQNMIDSLNNDVVVFDSKKISITPYICFWLDNYASVGGNFELYKNNEFYKGYEFDILELYKINISDLENGEYRIEYRSYKRRKIDRSKLHFLIINNEGSGQ
jgi:hypothetical protein